jgi:hypothetical protein
MEGSVMMKRRRGRCRRQQDESSLYKEQGDNGLGDREKKCKKEKKDSNN